MYLLLLNITRLPVDLEIWVPMGAVNITVYLFLAAWGIVLLRNVIRIFRSDPIEILRRTSQGEQEPRSRWLIALTGACTLTAGYALALTVQDPSMVLAIFLAGYDSGHHRHLLHLLGSQHCGAQSHAEKPPVLLSSG